MDAGAAPFLPSEASSVGAKETASRAAQPAAAPSARETPLPPASATTAAVDPLCKTHTFCEVMQLYARAMRGDGEARAVVTADVAQRGCDYPMADITADQCGNYGCMIYFGGKVAEAELRRHIVRSGVLPPKTRDLPAAPFDALPRIPIEARPIVSALAACLSDFVADPMPDPFPVEIEKGSAYWWPALGGVYFWRDGGSSRQKASLNWQIANTEVVEHSGESDVTDPIAWEYTVTFDEPLGGDGGPIDPRSRDAGAGVAAHR